MGEILFKDEYGTDEEQPPQPTGKVIDLNTGDFVETPQQPVDQPQMQPTAFPEAQGFFDDMFGDDSRASTDLPELGGGGLLSDQDPAKMLKVAPILLTTLKNEEIADIITAEFPDIGKQYTPSGEIILANNNTGTKVVVNKPGFSQIDLLQTLGIASAFTPASRGAMIGTQGVANVTKGVVAQRALQAGVGAGLTQTGIETAQSNVGGEFDKDEVAIAAALGGASEVVVPAFQSLRKSRQLKKVSSTVDDLNTITLDVNTAKQSVDKVKQASGQAVDLFQAQQTNVPSELLKQRLMPQLDAGSRIAATALEKQNKQAFDAVTGLIDTIAKPEVVATGSKAFRTASTNAIKAAKTERRVAAAPLFESGLEVGGQANVEGIKTTIKGLLKDSVPGQTQKTLRNVFKNLTGKKGLPPTLRQLDNAKTEINDVLEKLGEGAVSKRTKSLLTGIKKDLVQALEDASPDYHEAMNIYRKMSPAIEELEESVIGQVSKLSDANLKNVAQKIFDPKNAATNPTVVKNAKTVIDKIDPNAWDSLLRVELNRRVGGLTEIVDDVSGELVGNVPGQLRRAIFGNPAQRKALLSGMSPQQRSNFVYLDDVLKRASSGRQAGSPTTPFKEIADRLRGTAVVVRDWVVHPLRSAQGVGEQTLFDRNVKALTEVLFDTKYAKQFNELKKLNSESPAAARALTQMLTSAQKEK